MQPADRQGQAHRQGKEYLKNKERSRNVASGRTPYIRNMKFFFSTVLILLVIWSAIMHLTSPRAVQDGRVSLIWVTGDHPARREQVAFFNEMSEQVRVSLDPESVGREKVVVQCLAGVGPDLFDIFDGFDLMAFVKAGIVMDITEELEQHDLSVQRDTWSATHTTALFEGRAYGFPRGASADALLFNKELLEAQGVPHPESLVIGEEFLEMARKLTIRDERGRTLQFGFQFEWWQYRHFLRQWGARIYSEDGTRCLLDSPEAIAAVQFMYDLIWKHGVSPSPAQTAALPSSGGYGSGKINIFGSGQAAMALAGRWWMPVLRANFPELKFGVSECVFGPLRRHRGYTAVTAINRLGRHPEMALEILLMMATAEYNQLINRQADGVGPMKKHSQSETFLSAADYADEAYNPVWAGVMRRSVPDEVSPFVSGAAANRIVTRQLDLVANNLKTPGEALRDAARQINREIAVTVERDPVLKEMYMERTGGL